MSWGAFYARLLFGSTENERSGTIFGESISWSCKGKSEKNTRVLQVKIFHVKSYLFYNESAKSAATEIFLYVLYVLTFLYINNV